MVDLFHLAESRGFKIVEDFEALGNARSPDEMKVLREFAEWVAAKATISINAPLFVFVELIGGREYQNVYEWAIEQSAISGRGVEEILRNGSMPGLIVEWRLTTRLKTVGRCVTVL